MENCDKIKHCPAERRRWNVSTSPSSSSSSSSSTTSTDGSRSVFKKQMFQIFRIKKLPKQKISLRFSLTGVFASTGVKQSHLVLVSGVKNCFQPFFSIFNFFGGLFLLFCTQEIRLRRLKDAFGVGSPTFARMSFFLSTLFYWCIHLVKLISEYRSWKSNKNA